MAPNPPRFESIEIPERPSVASERAPGPRPSRRMLLWGGVAGAGVLALAALGLVFSGGPEKAARAPGEAPLIKAGDQPIKVTPENPGGMEVPNRDMMVYGRIQGTPGGKPPVERLLPEPEQPMTPPAPTSPAPISPAPISSAPTSPSPAASAPTPLAPPAAEPPAAAVPPVPPAPTPSSPPAWTAPSVAPPPAAEGSAAARSAPTHSVAPVREPPTTERQTPAPTVPERRPPEHAAPAASPPPKPAAPAPKPPVAVASVPKPPPAPAPAKPAEVAKAAPPESPPAAASGRYQVQIFAGRSPEEAAAAWARLRGRYPDILSPLGPTYARADLGDRGTFYRLRAGPLESEAKAKAVCSALAGRGASCIIIRPGA